MLKKECLYVKLICVAEYVKDYNNNYKENNMDAKEEKILKIHAANIRK